VLLTEDFGGLADVFVDGFQVFGSWFSEQERARVEKEFAIGAELISDAGKY